MTQPVGRAIRYRRTLVLADRQEASVFAHNSGGTPRVALSLHGFTKGVSPRRYPIPVAHVTTEQAERLRDMLTVGIQTAAALRAGRVFDPDAVERALLHSERRHPS